jgi:alpha-D-xyloside xylohydrolase
MKHFFPVAFSFFFLLFSFSSRSQVRSYVRVPGGVRFQLDKGLMEIDVLAPDLIRVRYTSLDTLAEKHSLVVASGLPAAPAFTLTEKEGKILLVTGRVTVEVDRGTNAIAYLDPAGASHGQADGGRTILAEDGAEGKSMSPATVVGEATYTCGTRFLSPGDEALFGLGCHPLDSLSIDYKGRTQEMAIKYLTGAIPVLLSSRGFGLLWDNYSQSRWDGTEGGNTKFSYSSESGKMIDYYFFYGPSFDHIIDLYRQLTGRAPMYPKWAYGLFQSQDRYKTQQEVLAAAHGYRSRHIPVDAVVQDWYYWSPLPIGSHVMYPPNYPDPVKMVDELHRENVHAMISIWPCFGSGTANFDALKAAGFLTSITWDNFTTHTRDTYYDAHDPRAREMYWQQARDSLIRRDGWDAWWVDQCEPDTEDPDNRKKALFYPGKGLDYFNSYSLEHTKGIYQGWRRDIPHKRIFLLARQAFAGQQRNAATLWSSDISTTFRAFREQVPQAINACVSGIPYWTSDIGGYLSHTSPGGVPDWSQPAYRELFTRWFQFGAFCPIFRIHGKGERALFSANWDEATRDILLKYDRLRYRLLPYIYSLAGKTTLENYTPMRSLVFDFRTDTNVYHIPDQYMYGPAFLVNPVTSPLYTGDGGEGKAKVRSIYLPQGATWYDFWTGVSYQGGQRIDAPAPIGIMPLYVRAGSIVPMGPVMEYATERPSDTLELRIYPGADGSFTLYEDENDSYDYEKGAYATIRLDWNDSRRQLLIHATKGSYPGMLTHRVFRVVLVRAGRAVGEQPETNFDKVVTYTGSRLLFLHL